MQTSSNFTIDAFIDFYKPLATAMSSEGNYSLEYFIIPLDDSKIQETIKNEPNKVWTLLDVDGVQVVSPGVHFVNREGYIMTEIPWNESTGDAIDPQVTKKVVLYVESENNFNEVDDVENYISDLMERAQDLQYANNHSIDEIKQIASIREDLGLYQESQLTESHSCYKVTLTVYFFEDNDCSDDEYKKHLNEANESLNDDDVVTTEQFMVYSVKSEETVNAVQHCPKCGSGKLKKSDGGINGQYALVNAECDNCSHEWNEVYTLTSVQSV